MRKWMRARTRLRRRGLTLIEVMLAIVVILMGITATLALLGQAAISEARARHKMMVSTTVQDMLGRMDATEFAALTEDNPDFSAAVLQARLEEAGVPSPQVSLAIAPYPDPSTQHLKRVAIRVQYGNSKLRGNVDFETLFADDTANM